jgi:hypothetical protein
MRLYRGLFRPLGAFTRAQFSADYTISMFGFNLRQGQCVPGRATIAGLCHRCGSARPERESSNRLVGTASQKELYETFPRHRRRINRLDLPFGSETPKLPLHRVDPGKIDRDVVVAAAFARHQFKTTAGEDCGRTGTAEMDDGSEILRLLQTRYCVWPASEYFRDIPVQRHRRKLDCMARH